MSIEVVVGQSCRWAWLRGSFLHLIGSIAFDVDSSTKNGCEEQIWVSSEWGMKVVHQVVRYIHSAFPDV